jgi:hypothetical protein
MLSAGAATAYVRILHSSAGKYVLSAYCVGAPVADTFGLA